MTDSKFGTSLIKLEQIFEDVQTELHRATRKHGVMMSFHHGHSVILEELDELWDAIKANDRDQALKEAHEVAATAIRFIHDLGG